MNIDEKKKTIFKPAICPQCGGQVEVDAQRESAFCQYCGTKFIVEKAINTYNIQHATIAHVDSITIHKHSAVESLLNFVKDQQNRVDEEKREEEARQKEEERKKKEEEEKDSKKNSWVLLLMFLISFGVLFFMYLEEEKINKISINESSSELKGANYQDVVSKLQENGFINIKTEPKKDIVFGLLAKDGEVERVEINGDDEFESGTKFPEDADIIVIYHTFRWEKDRNAEPSPAAPGN